jgi:4-alpha-glucanotransferase
VKTSRDAPIELRELAQLCGIQTFYLAADETMREAEPDVLMALLRTLGVPVERPKDVTEALRERRLAAARRIMEPVLVVRPGRSSTIAISLPDHFNAREAWFTLTFEDGTERRERLLADSSPIERIELEGHRFHRYAIEYTAAETSRTPLGYHSMTVEVADAHRITTTAQSLVISAPECPDATRGWGAFLPLHALRSADDWGLGSYTDLARLGEWIADQGGAFVGGLPLYPTYLDPPIDPSPYRPVSRLAYNELYIDPTALPELTLSSTARELLGSSSFLTRIENARSSEFVDYEEVAHLRRQVLEPVADAFFATTSPRREEFATFLDAHPELLAYGEFRGAVDQLGRQAVVSLAGVPEIPGETSPSLNYHLYCQWVASEQLQKAGETISLYADLPVGVHPDGFDPYWSPSSFVTGANGGAPPDMFFDGGQDWGFPPLHPEGIREGGYHYVRAVLERVMRHASYLRIDHVMGLQRLYVIPEGFDARHGAYVSYHADEMHALVSLEAQRAGSVVIGEDLGTVPDEVHERMADDRMLRSWVFEFESSVDDPLPDAPSDVLASLATHDTPRFSSFLWGSDIDDAEKGGRYTAQQADARRAERALYRESLFRALEIPVLAPAELTKAARSGCEAQLAASEATLFLVDLEELWGESEPQNRPGTEHGNWRQRGALTLEEAKDSTEIAKSLERINDLRKLFTS